jgi:hypothetical protein
MTPVGPSGLQLAAVALIILTGFGLLLPGHVVELVLNAHTEAFLHDAISAFGCW